MERIWRRKERTKEVEVKTRKITLAVDKACVAI